MSKVGRVFLHSGRGAGVAVRHRAIDHIETGLPLIQPQLVVGLQGGVSEIDAAPFDVEDTVGRTPRYRGEDAAQSVGISRAASPA